MASLAQQAWRLRYLTKKRPIEKQNVPSITDGITPSGDASVRIGCGSVWRDSKPESAKSMLAVGWELSQNFFMRAGEREVG